MRLCGVEFAGLDKGGDGGPVFYAGIVTGEEGILAVQGDGANGPLDGVVVEFDAAIGEEQRLRICHFAGIVFNVRRGLGLQPFNP